MNYRNHMSRMAIEPTEDNKKLIRDGLWGALWQVKLETPGAMHQAERLFELALQGDADLLLRMKALREEGTLRRAGER